MRTYRQLTQEQRYQIYALKKTGHTRTEIAEVIGVHKSTVSRELKRNRGGRGYRPQQAHALALVRKQKSVPRITMEVWAKVESLLRQDWSPEQISGRLKKEQKVCISHEWIYQYVLKDKQAGGDLYRHLRCQKKRRKRYGTYDRRGKLPNCRSIEERPAIVNTRKRLGERLTQAQKFEKANEIQNAIALYEENINDGFLASLPYERLRIIYEKQKNYQNAIRVCKRYIEILQMVSTIWSQFPNIRQIPKYQEIIKKLNAKVKAV
jgi:IS30 family transposase